ncbi:hypothetical protein M758_7G038200 [Ceratodon purpureus]|nr:hypothetical protein M758_7G038200 [Ceratodon purpureus]KAG0610093.1 hypothetical protein M758_7G038200 [Ceratodon purpureus]
MDPTDSSLRAYPGETNQNLQAPDHQYNNSMIAADSYNFMTGGGVLVVPGKDQASQLQGPQLSEDGAVGQDHASGPLIGTLYTNQHQPSSGDYPSQSPSVPKSLWESLNGGGLYNNPSMQNLLIGGTGMMTAPTSAVTAQLLIGGLQGGSFNDGGHSDHGGVYYPPAPNNQQEPMAQALYYVNTAGYSSNAGFHSEGRDQVSATTISYPTHDEGTATPQAACDPGQQQYGVDPYLAASAGGLPLSLHDQHSASRCANQNFNWRNVGNEHSFLPMNEDSQNHQSQFETDPHVPQFNVSRHDLSHMQQTDHMSNGVGLHMERLKGIAVNGQGLSLSLSSHQSHFQSVGGQLQESDQMGTIDQAAAMAKTKELASRYLAGGNADLSRFRTHSRDDAIMGAKFLQEHIDSAGRTHLAASSHGNPSGAGPSNHISASRFLRSAQAILNEVCRVTALKRPPRPARSSDHQQYNNWNSMAGVSASASVDGNFTYTGKEDSARSSILNEVDSGRDSAPAFNIHSSPLLAVSQMALVDHSEMIQGLADAARTQNRDGLESKKQKLGLLLEEQVEARYRRYCDQLQLVITAFNSQAGPNTATPYTILALQAMSRHFRCLRDAIGNQLKVVKRALGEEVDRNAGLGESSRLRYVDQQIRQQRALQQLGMLQQHAWRPQRGLPERAVSVLRAWLFEHFLHPYPKDVDKLSLAKQTGLTRSQVSNWFINARVRLWKPMVEEMYVEEQKENDERQAAERAARDQAGIENGTFEQFEGDRGNSGLLHEVSANAQVSRPIPSAKTRNEDKEHVDNGPSVVTEVGGTSAEVHPHPVIPAGRSLDADVAGNHNQDGRETKKARPNSASEGFKPVIASPMPPGMNVEGGKLAEEALNVHGEDGRVKEDTDFETHSQVLDQNLNQDQNGFTHVSQQGTATVDNIQPIIGGGAFGAFDGHNLGHRSYASHESELRCYATRAASVTSTGTVSLTLGLRHCDVNQNRSSLVSPNCDFADPYGNIDRNDQINQLNRPVDLYEGRTGDVSYNGHTTSTAMSNGHYLAPVLQDNSTNSKNSNNSNNSHGQQLSSPHREF